MCFVVAPAVAMGIAMATSVASAGIAAYGAEQQGQAQAKAATYQAQVAQNNQTIANQEAAATDQAEQSAETASRLKTAGAISSVRAAAGASGIDPNSGSPLGNVQSTAEMGELDALTIRSNYAREKYNYEVQGMSAGAQSTLDMAQASNASAAGDLGAFSSILSGASSLSSKWSSWQLAAGNNSTQPLMGTNTLFPNSTSDFGAMSVGQLS